MAGRINHYRALLEGLRGKGFSIGPIRHYFENRLRPAIYLRHDVDRLSFRAHHMAELEHELGIRSTYYVRCNSRGEFARPLVQSLSRLGHEIGFHYESLVFAGGDSSRALEIFYKQLQSLRELAEIRTISAHGSVLSKHDNRLLLTNIDRDQAGIYGDAGVHIDFSNLFYVTDTGGTFGSAWNVRDFVDGDMLHGKHTPTELASLLSPDRHPEIVINTHPERWARGVPGFVQASCTDYAVNFAKCIRLLLTRESFTNISRPKPLAARIAPKSVK